MPGTIVNHPTTAGLVRHPSTLDINHPASGGATNHPAGFSGNFAQLVTSIGLTALQVTQSDLGGTYGGTLLDTGGAGPVCTLTGTLNAALPFVPLLLKCTLGGALGVWTWSLYSDGGTTPFQTGTSAAGPTALTGAAAGLSLSIAAGVAVLNNTWNATLAAWADQSGNGNHWSQATPAKQFKITTGINGKPGLLSDGVNDLMTAALALPAPGTTPSWHGLVCRVVTWTSSGVITSDASGNSGLLFMNAVTPLVRAFNATGGTQQSVVVNTWECTEAGFTNSVNDYIRRGSNAASAGTILGNNASASRTLAGLASSNFGNVEFVHQVVTNTIPNATQIAAWRAAVTSFYGSTVQV